MNAIDPTVKQKLINHFSAEPADIKPLIQEDFENDHYDTPTVFAMVVAVGHGLVLLKDGADGLVYLKKTVESIEWLIDKLRRMAKTDSEKTPQGLDERERVMATLAKHQVSTGEGLSAKTISAATLIPEDAVAAILDQLVKAQIIGQVDGKWMIEVEDLSA